MRQFEGKGQSPWKKKTSDFLIFLLILSTVKPSSVHAVLDL
jgi:hypothetical protein